MHLRLDANTAGVSLGSILRPCNRESSSMMSRTERARVLGCLGGASENDERPKLLKGAYTGDPHAVSVHHVLSKKNGDDGCLSGALQRQGHLVLQQHHV